MIQLKTKKPNTALLRARRRRVFERKQVSSLLGYRGTQVLAAYERGETIPGIENAVKLSLIYNCSLEDIFPEVYKAARQNLSRSALAKSLPGNVSASLRGMHACSFEDLLSDPATAEPYRGMVRDHITRLAKTLAAL
jgi:transcriptional regulator with XRE-family HTH domain